MAGWKPQQKSAMMAIIKDMMAAVLIVRLRSVEIAGLIVGKNVTMAINTVEMDAPKIALLSTAAMEEDNKSKSVMILTILMAMDVLPIANLKTVETNKSMGQKSVMMVIYLTMITAFAAEMPSVGMELFKMR